MKLLIIRHAVAMEREDFQLSNDDLRPLTAKGKKEFKKATKGYKKLYPDIEEFYSSPLVRAKETAEILKKRFKKNYKIIHELKPDGDFGDLLNKLKESQKDFIAIVGHEPFLSQFVGFAVTGKSKPIVEMKKGGACLLELGNGSTKILSLHSQESILKLCKLN